MGGQPKLRVGGRHHARAADIARGCMCSSHFFPFLKIFLSVFDFSKGKNIFFKKFSNNGLVSKKIEKKLSLSRVGWGSRPKVIKITFFLPFPKAFSVRNHCKMLSYLLDVWSVLFCLKMKMLIGVKKVAQDHKNNTEK